MSSPAKILILATLLVGCAAAATAQSGPMGGGGPGGEGGPGGGGGRMGGGERGAPGGAQRQPRQVKPLSRERYDKVVTALFRSGDANRDGVIALAELNALLDARREEIIRARFNRLDSNRDGMIGLNEFTAWQKQMGTLARDEQDAMGHRDLVVDELAPAASEDEQDEMAAAVIEPVNPTVLVWANTNYDAGVSLAELIAYEGKSFDKADANHDGWLVMDELRPARPAGGGMGGGGMGSGGMGGPRGGEGRAGPGGQGGPS